MGVAEVVKMEVPAAQRPASPAPEGAWSTRSAPRMLGSRY
jgi:hypothetical protein